MRPLSRTIGGNSALYTHAKFGVLIALALSGSAMAGSMFCCLDASGKQECGDILPQACYGRAYRELGESGRTLRNVEAPLTAAQRAQRAVEEEQRKVEAAALKEQQRKDQALLNTYGSEKDIETMRLRAQDDVQKSIKNSEDQIAGIRLRRKKFEDEAEFYKKKQPPPEIQKGLRDTDLEIKSQESVIEAKKKELDNIRVKFDEDRRRFLELTKQTSVEAAPH